MTYEEWLHKRKESIGASESGAILGLNPWRSAMDVYFDKVGETEPIEDNLNMRLGRDLEPIIKKLFEEETELTVRNDNKIRIDEQHSFITTNLDGMVVGKKVPIEYKTMGKWDGEISDTYYAQIQHQMMVTNTPYIYFVALVLGFNKNLIIEKYDRDDDFIAEMRHELVNFWHGNVLTKTPPDAKSYDDVSKLFKKSREGSHKPADIHIMDCCSYLNELIVRKKNIEKTIKEEKKGIMSYMGEYETIEFQGIPIATWKKTKDSLKFDNNSFKNDHPELYKEYLINRDGYRRFNLKNTEK